MADWRRGGEPAVLAAIMPGSGAVINAKYENVIDHSDALLQTAADHRWNAEP
jgi:hypothetical protein